MPFRPTTARPFLRHPRSGTGRAGVGRTAAAALLAAGLAVTTLPAGPVGAEAAPRTSPTVDLRADTNRDGTVDLSGIADESVEDTARALFLPNVDDDTNRCRSIPTGFRSDRRLDRCNDAADRVVNGRNDERDLARFHLLPVEGLARGTAGRLQVSGAENVNIFLRTGNRWQLVRPGTRFSGRQLAQGMEFGIEGRDIVRDPAVWDGTVTLVMSLDSKAGAAADTITMQVAPMLTHTHTQSVDEVLVIRPYSPQDTDQVEFNRQLSEAVAAAGVTAPVREIGGGDRWVQDIFEPMHASIPGPDGVQSMRLLVRSDQDRPGSRALYRLRGRDVGVIWMGPDPTGGTRDSFGNLETIPAYSHNGEHFPAGRIIYGEDTRPGAEDSMSERVLTALRAQGMQSPLALDTSFLAVGHVDEQIQFLPADTPRGWKVAVADPLAGLELLRQAQASGQGSSTVINRPDQTITVDQALTDAELGFVADNERAARIIEANLDKIQAATGVTDDEVVRIPSVYGDSYINFPFDEFDDRSASSILAFPTEEPTDTEAVIRDRIASSEQAAPGSDGRQLAAYVPGAINGIVIGETVLVPKQFGVEVDGRDIFAAAVEQAYRDAGLSVLFVDGWIYHQGQGEIHCATNTLRNTSAPWWLSAS